MASENTPTENTEKEKQNTERNEEFTKDIDAIKEKYKFESLIVTAAPEQSNDVLIYISSSDNPFFVLQTSSRLIDFHIEKEIRQFEVSRNKALGVLGLIEKIVDGKLGKPAN